MKTNRCFFNECNWEVENFQVGKNDPVRVDKEAVFQLVLKCHLKGPY